MCDCMCVIYVKPDIYIYIYMHATIVKARKQQALDGGCDIYDVHHIYTCMYACVFVCV